MTGDLVIALTTLPSRDSAERVADEVVSAGLAACAQVDGPVLSRYVWEGKSCRAEEWRLTLKTDPERETALRERVHALHPHQTPQWVTLSAGASTDYLEWVRATCRA